MFAEAGKGHAVPIARPTPSPAQFERERKQWEREQAEADWQDEQAAKDDDEAEQPAEYETGLAADSIGARLLADVREQVETARLQGEALARSAIENRRASESQNQVVEYRPYAPAPTGLGIYLDTDIVDLWAAERSPAAKTKDSYKRVTEWRHERIGRKSVEQFTRKYILAFKGKPLAEGRTPQNVNVKLGNLRTLLNGPSITTMPKSILHLGSC